ncbi:MAG TPA: RNA polymerase sigma factor [Phycisphaerae bacterium]|nr:RNA polymerase sigma factor [Phycisphaerae bacterium]
MDRLDDAQLIGLIARGHEWAFERLLRRYRQSLMRLLYALTADRALAEDLFQETFVTLVEKASSYQPTGSARHWVFTIARHKALNALSESHRRRARLLAFAGADASSGRTGANDSSARAANAELQAAFEAALGDLPPVVRACFVMQRFDRFSHAQVSRLLELPLGTVKTHIRRARDHLRRELRPFMD